MTPDPHTEPRPIIRYTCPHFDVHHRASTGADAPLPLEVEPLAQIIHEERGHTAASRFEDCAASGCDYDLADRIAARLTTEGER